MAGHKQPPKEHTFKQGESGNPNGRPKKINTLIQDLFLSEANLRLSKSQTQEIIESILSKSKNELAALLKNDDLPFWVSLIVKKANKDFEHGSIELIEKLWDRVHGKPKQTNEITGADGKDLIPNDFLNMSKDELREYLRDKK